MSSRPSGYYNARWDKSLAISQLLSVCVYTTARSSYMESGLRWATAVVDATLFCLFVQTVYWYRGEDGQTQQDHSPVAGRWVARQNGIIADVNTGYNRTTSALSVSGTALLPLQGDLAAHWCQRIQPAIIAVCDGRSESNIDVVRIEFLFRGVHAAHYSYVNTFIKRHARVLFHNNAVL